jgi:hypothetical protein
LQYGLRFNSVPGHHLDQSFKFRPQPWPILSVGNEAWGEGSCAKGHTSALLRFEPAAVRVLNCFNPCSSRRTTAPRDQQTNDVRHRQTELITTEPRLLLKN